MELPMATSNEDVVVMIASLLQRFHWPLESLAFQKQKQHKCSSTQFVEYAKPKPQQTKKGFISTTTIPAVQNPRLVATVSEAFFVTNATPSSVSLTMTPKS
jgi:hypothetical protein